MNVPLLIWKDSNDLATAAVLCCVNLTGSQLTGPEWKAVPNWSNHWEFGVRRWGESRKRQTLTRKSKKTGSSLGPLEGTPVNTLILGLLTSSTVR